MNKIMNNISTIVCNDLLKALEINFSKPGELSQYNESMQLAMDLSVIHRINCWIVEKKNFQDLKLENFLMLLFSWAKIAKNKNKAGQKVLIVTTADIANKINTILQKEWWQKRYNRPDIKIQTFFQKRKETIPLEMVED